jgi:hypothetical protein
MSRYLQIFRASVPQANVERLLAVRPEAIAEAQRLCPALIDAELVKFQDGTWLDILTWDQPNGEELLMARASEFVVLPEMHGLLTDVSVPEFGEIQHSTHVSAPVGRR